MKLYHATSVDNLPKIWEKGLTPSDDGEHPVHLSENDEIHTFVHELGRDLEEAENGHQAVTVTLEVDCAGLDLDGPRADDFVPDNDEHHMCWETIDPSRLKIVRVWRGFR